MNRYIIPKMDLVTMGNNVLACSHICDVRGGFLFLKETKKGNEVTAGPPQEPTPIERYAVIGYVGPYIIYVLSLKISVI